MLEVGSYDAKNAEMMDMIFFKCESFNQRTHDQLSGNAEA